MIRGYILLPQLNIFMFQVHLKDQRDFDPNIMLDSVCLPPLSPIPSVNEEIGKTLVLI